MRVTVDGDLCSRCGLCVELAPDVFEMGDDSAVVIVDEVPADHVEEVREAAEGCPEGAITIEED